MARAPITAIATVVRRIEPAGPGVKRFTLEDPDGWDLPRARPGAHIDLHLPGGILRTYSLCGGPHDDTHYVVAVKREDAGRGGSVSLHDLVQEGDALGVSLPRGGIPLPMGERHVFIAGGIGVTPFLSAASALLHRGDRNFVLHVVARGEPPLADMLAPLCEPGLAVVHDSRLSRPDLFALIGPLRPGVRLACCGPAGMLDAFEAATRDWPSAQVHIERFVPPPVVVDPMARPYTLVLGRSGVSRDVPAGMAMLDAIAACGVDVPTSCGGGICGACRVGVLEGSVLHHDRFLSPAEREHSALVCVAGCAGGRLVLDL
jgi:ferredoxin-NADP reductase